jgi:hypothetical protein
VPPMDFSNPTARSHPRGSLAPLEPVWHASRPAGRSSPEFSPLSRIDLAATNTTGLINHPPARLPLFLAARGTSPHLASTASP